MCREVHPGVCASRDENVMELVQSINVKLCRFGRTFDLKSGSPLFLFNGEGHRFFVLLSMLKKSTCVFTRCEDVSEIADLHLRLSGSMTATHSTSYELAKDSHALCTLHSHRDHSTLSTSLLPLSLQIA